MTAPTFLFIGDSITDDGRTIKGIELGEGYVRLIDRALASVDPRPTVVNRGINGDRVEALRRRWAVDALDVAPTRLTVMIGINDTWRRYDSDDPTTAEAFEDDYRAILDASARGGAAITLYEPFLVPVLAGQDEWRYDLDPKIAVVRKLADEFGATLIRTDEAFAREADRVGAAFLLPDGVHPSDAGRRLLADLWLAEHG